MALKYVFILCAMAFILGAGGACAIIGGTNRQLDTELRDSRNRIIELDQQYREIESHYQELGARLNRVVVGVREAKSLVDSISGSGFTAIETVRTVIGNLQKLKRILEGITDN